VTQCVIGEQRVSLLKLHGEIGQRLHGVSKIGFGLSYRIEDAALQHVERLRGEGRLFL